MLMRETVIDRFTLAYRRHRGWRREYLGCRGAVLCGPELSK